MTDQAAEVPDGAGAREYLLALRRRWRMVALVTCATVAMALVYSFTATPSYLASADVIIEPSGVEVQAGTSRVDAEEVATQTQVVTSLPVARLVRERLRLRETPDLSELVTVQGVGTSRILRITAQDTSARRAASTANTVATAYLQFRQQDSIERYEEAADRLSQEQADVERRLAEVNRLLQTDEGRVLSLEAERRSLLTALAQLSTQLDSLGDALTTAAAGGELLQQASPPERPVSPQTGLNAILGALFGLMLGAGAALVRDRFDDVVHDEDSLKQAVGTTAVLGRVPRWSEQTYRGRLVTLLDPAAPASEEFQRLAVNLRFMLATTEHDRHGGAIVLVTSAQEGEGKTVTACNLAVAAARLGLRVVLVDADLRRASVAPRFGLGNPPGLSDLLVGEGRVDDFLIGSGTQGLTYLAAGTIPPNPVALLSSGKMGAVLRALAAEADLVVVDSPPVLVGADTLQLANHPDMVLVVARDGFSRRRQIVSALESLGHVAVSTVGIVYNGVGDGRRNYTYTRRERSPSHGEVPADDTASVEQPSVARTLLGSRRVASSSLRGKGKVRDHSLHQPGQLA